MGWSSLGIRSTGQCRGYVSAALRLLIWQTLLGEPDHIESLKGGNIPRRITVKEISFGAHVDYAQNSKFIQEIGPQHIVLVHGEAVAMGRLRAALRDSYVARGQEINIHAPKNCEPLTLSFRAERMVKVRSNIEARQLTLFAGDRVAC